MTLRKALCGLLLPVLLLGGPAALAGERAYSCDDLAERAVLSAFGVPVHQGDDGWFFRSGEINHFYPMSDRAATFLKRLDAVLKAHGVQLVLMPLPSKSMLAPAHAAVAAAADNLVFDPAFARAAFEARLQSFRDLGVPVVDVLAQIDRAADPDIEYYFPQDLHWRPELARASAQATATTLSALFPQTFPGTKSYQTRLKSAEPAIHRANSGPLLNQLCASSVPAETLPLYETVEVDQSVDAFLGDADAAPVNVIGTSFTEETRVYNFSGFLREALQTDVASYSIIGGGITQALYRWAHTGQARAGAQVLLWELHFIDRLEAVATTLARTVVPAIAGSCRDTGNEIFAADYALTDEAPVTLTLPETIKLSGDAYYLELGLSDPTARGVAVEFGYRDGRRDVLPVVRESRVGAIDTIYAELSPDLPGELGSITLSAMQPGQNAGRLALCRYPLAMPHGAQSGGSGAAVVLTTGQEVKK